MLGSISLIRASTDAMLLSVSMKEAIGRISAIRTSRHAIPICVVGRLRGLLSTIKNVRTFQRDWFDA